MQFIEDQRFRCAPCTFRVPEIESCHLDGYSPHEYVHGCSETCGATPRGSDVSSHLNVEAVDIAAQ